MSLALVALLVSNGFGLVFPLVIVQLLDAVTKATTDGLLNVLALARLYAMQFRDPEELASAWAQMKKDDKPHEPRTLPEPRTGFLNILRATG